MAEHEIHEDHGHNTAIWTAVGIILLGAALCSWAVVVTSVTLFVIGAVVCVVGAVAGKVLSMAGYGAKTLDGPDAPDTPKSSVGVK
ncbi:HGxxPAAW family protein [Pedococcus sp. 5OH_020]|uniref:HGxxPAAW family protein n=1 Tax=Pedococcus sp. 5OH_020 TaxID=2989814 RepID=UPI0022EA05ED|nr:HGxxPAAW family protein [Pedococcus sp. 5OH_020]